MQSLILEKADKTINKTWAIIMKITAPTLDLEAMPIEVDAETRKPVEQFIFLTM